MEQITAFLLENAIWILMTGMLILLMLQVITLHRIRKVQKLAETKEDVKATTKMPKAEETQSVVPEEENMEMRLQHGKEKEEEAAEQEKESPEKLIEAVLSEVFS